MSFWAASSRYHAVITIDCACILCSADEVIWNMPGGFAAMLGPPAAKIFGGHQRRLALAGALLRPATAEATRTRALAGQHQARRMKTHYRQLAG
ncbi:MAG TPA: hypothetical protein VKO85_01570 [Wenzhouxiangellaceae bacterium]|nr:hypothetical protein [Wenzhouxiangellaceae bacterium]